MYIKTGKSMRVLALFLALFVMLMPVATVPVQADTWTEVSTWNELYTALENGGNIRLTQDLAYDESSNNGENFGIPAGVHVTLDLNGHIINRGITGSANNEFIFDLQPGNSNSCSLTLEDSRPNQTHNPEITYVDPVTGLAVPVTGGILTGAAGVAVRFSNSATVFTMNGGSIVGCDNRGDGGGVYLYSGNFVMNGGLIAGNKATHNSECKGGGVYCSSGTTFTMNGGKITGNSAYENGGGVYNAGTFTMTGGEISNNTCTLTNAGYAGGVSKPFTVSGNVIIQGNKKGVAGSRVDSNVYLNSALTIAGDLNSASRIGVTAGTSTAFTSGLASGLDNSHGIASNFTSDNASYDVVIDNGEAKLTEVRTVTITPGSNMTTSAISGLSQRVVNTGSITSVAFTADEGYFFPTNYSVEAVNGISVTRDSYTQITVSGTPSAVTTINLVAATAKTKETTPNASFTANGADSGTLSSVTADMKYSLDGGSNWTACGNTSVSLTGVGTTNGIKVIKPASNTDEKYDSDPQSITITQQSTPTLTATQPSSEGGQGSIPTTTDYQKSTDNSTWTNCTGAWADLDPGTYYVRKKANGTALASAAQTIVITAYTPGAYAVSVTAGTGMTPTTAYNESVTQGSAMTTQTYTAADGYYFPTDYASIGTTTGVEVARTDFTQITVFGTPTAATTITLANATAKVKEATPTATYTTTNPDDKTAGTLSGVTTGMKYSLDGGSTWTACTGTTVDLTGVDTSLGIKIKTVSTDADTRLDSDVQTITFSTPAPSSGGHSGGGSSGNTTTTTTTTTTNNPDSSKTTDTTTTTVTKNGDGSTSTKTSATGTTAAYDGSTAKTVSESTTVTTKNQDGTTTDKTTGTSTTTAQSGAKTESTISETTTTKEEAGGGTTATTTATENIVNTAADGTKTTAEVKTEAVTKLDANGNGTVTATATETVKNEAGEVTATTVTESSGTVKTAADGTVTTTVSNVATTTDAQGKEQVVKTTETTIEQANGTVGSTVADASGNTILAEAKVSEEAVAEALKNDGSIELPVVVNTNAAAPVAITLPGGSKGVTVEIPVANMTDGTVAVRVNPDGTEEIIKTSVNEGDNVVVQLEGSATVKIVDNTKDFVDVPDTAWYAKDVAWAASHEVMNGIGGKTFAGYLRTSTAMVSQMLFNLDGAKASGNVASNLADVKAGDWYAPSVTWMVESGIAKGDGYSFGANMPITFERLAVMYFNYAKFKGYDTEARADISGFADVADVSPWAKEALSWAVANEVVNGTPDGKGSIYFMGHGSATRAQLAAMTQRFCQKVAR